MAKKSDKSINKKTREKKEKKEKKENVIKREPKIYRNGPTVVRTVRGGKYAEFIGDGNANVIFNKVLGKLYEKKGQNACKKCEDDFSKSTEAVLYAKDAAKNYYYNWQMKNVDPAITKYLKCGNLINKTITDKMISQDYPKYSDSKMEKLISILFKNNGKLITKNEQHRRKLLMDECKKNVNSEMNAQAEQFGKYAVEKLLYETVTHPDHGVALEYYNAIEPESGDIDKFISRRDDFSKLFEKN